MTKQIIILAAGKGTRMHSKKPKVLHKLAGKMLLQYVLDAAHTISSYPPIVVVGYEANTIKNAFEHENIIWIKQATQLGTGHAVQQTLPVFAAEDQVLVLCGDTPLISSKTLKLLVDHTPNDAIGMITATINRPKGYGRIIRNTAGQVINIIEERDANQEQKKIKEINAGIYVFPGDFLQKNLALLAANNAQQEYYLTDLIPLAIKNNRQIVTINPKIKEEIFGVNDKIQLSTLERVFQLEQAKKLMRQGVTLADPSRFDLRGELQAGKDVYIDINVIISGQVQLGDRVTIKANCVLNNVIVGDDVVISENSVLEDCNIANECQVGPFARLRPNTNLKEKSRVGNFVELKNATLGKGSKVNHLSYVGDAMVGNTVNIGAGTITCNYDGAAKHHTVIEDDAFIGSCTQLVAPITIGKGATIGAGSTLTEDAPPNKLTLARPKQITIEKWQRPIKEK